MSSSLFDGTVQEAPLVEKNRSRSSRKVLVKARKLGGRRGKAVRAFSKVLLLFPLFDDDVSADDMSTISSDMDAGVSHWGIQVGTYLWELHTDNKHAKSLMLQRLADDQIWSSDVQEWDVGTTTMTDSEIDYSGMRSPHLELLTGLESLTPCLAHKALSKMKSRYGGKYNEFENNCQHFIRFILLDILEDDEEHKKAVVQWLDRVVG